MDFGREGGVAECADGVEREIEGAGMPPSSGVVEGFVEMVKDGEKGVPIPDAWGVLRAASSRDQGGAAGVGAGAEGHHLAGKLSNIRLKYPISSCPSYCCPGV